VKNLLSIFFVGVYLLGSMQTYRVLIDFYWNRDDYTQNYCVNLDAGITQCRASCYLDKLLEEEKENEGSTQIALTKKLKSVEYPQNWNNVESEIEVPQHMHAAFNRNFYHFDFSDIIFHPPKS
jgi:hypothetical protein